MRLLWEERAWEDYLYWQTQDKKDPEESKHPDKGHSAESV